MLECGHTAEQVTRALAELATSFNLAQRKTSKWQRRSRRARQLCPHICNEVVHGRRAGTIPEPNAAGWEAYVSRRTGLNREQRDELIRSHLRPGHRQQSSPSRSSARRPAPTPKTTSTPGAPPPGDRPLAGWTHRDLAMKWRAVDARDISTHVLAILLGATHEQVPHYADHLTDILTDPPWRVRVRGRGVDGKKLQERVDDLLRQPRKNEKERS